MNLPESLEYWKFVGRSKDFYFDVREVILGGIPAGKFLETVGKHKYFLLTPEDSGESSNLPADLFWKKIMEAEEVYSDPIGEQSKVGGLLLEAVPYLSEFDHPVWLSLQLSRVLSDLGRETIFPLDSLELSDVKGFSFEVAFEGNRTFLFSYPNSVSESGLAWTEKSTKNLNGFFEPVSPPDGFITQGLLDRVKASGIRGAGGPVMENSYRYSLMTSKGVVSFEDSVESLEEEPFYKLVSEFSTKLGEDSGEITEIEGKVEMQGIDLVPDSDLRFGIALDDYSGKGFIGFWWRVLASLVDGMLYVFLAALIGFILVLGAGILFSGGPTSMLIAMGIIFCIFFLGFYFLEAWFLSSSWQATPGKKVCGMKVVDCHGNAITFKRALGRSFGKILSGWIGNVGYAWVGFHRFKQGWHDLMSKTFVVES